MVSGAHRAGDRDSGGGAGRRGLAFPVTLAKPQPFASEGAGLRSGGGRARCAPRCSCSQTLSTEARDQGLKATIRWTGSRVTLLPATAANALSLEQRPIPLRRGWGGAGTVGASALNPELPAGPGRSQGETPPPAPQVAPGPPAVLGSPRLSHCLPRGNSVGMRTSSAAPQSSPVAFPGIPTSAPTPYPVGAAAGQLPGVSICLGDTPRSWRPEDRPSLATTFG